MMHLFHHRHYQCDTFHMSLSLFEQVFWCNATDCRIHNYVGVGTGQSGNVCQILLSVKCLILDAAATHVGPAFIS